MGILHGCGTPPGPTPAQEGGDRIAVAINEAYRFANLAWRPDYAGATVTYAGRESVDGQTLDQLVITPKRGKPFGAWFDSNTHLLARITEDQQFFHKRILFAGYRRENGLMLAHEVTIDNGSGEGSYEYLRLTRFSLGAARPLGLLPTRRCRLPARYHRRWRGQHDGAVPPAQAITFMSQRGSMARGPYTFIVDTGGHALIAPELVSELGLKIVGAAAMSGAGEKTASVGFTRVQEFALGAARLHNQLGFTAPIYDPTIEGIRVDGMFGFELFRRFAVQIDYGRELLTLTDPTRFDAAGAGTAIPFVFYDHLPMVRGSIGDLPARFDIDTGSRAEIDITSPFTEAHELRARFSKGVSAVTGWGVGGPSRSYVVRLPSLTLGGVRVDNVVAGLSEDKGGSISDPNYEGNIGSGFLKRFVVTFDYAHQMMYLRPITPPPVDAGRFDRAGMWINSGPKGYVVTDVAANGPAAQAGIQVGDIITRLDGATPRFDGLSDARVLLRSRPAGTRIEVELQRAAEGRHATVTLRDQI